MSPVEAQDDIVGDPVPVVIVGVEIPAKCALAQVC
jgi:hypothetical protein